MPSMAGSGPGWSPHGPCRASRWCSRGQARASAFPYRAVAVTVAAAGTARSRRRRAGTRRRAAPGGRRRPTGRRGRGVHDPVGAQPPQDLHRQVAQQPRQPGQVVPGVEDGQDVGVALLPAAGGGQPGHDVAELRRGDLGRVVVRAEPDSVQRQRPRRPARLQRRDEGVRPARDHLPVPLAPRVAVAEQPPRAGLRVRPQPVRDIAGEPDPAVVPPPQRDRGHGLPQPRRSGPPRSSARRRRRRARGGTPAPGTAPPASAPAPACTAPRRRPRTGHRGASRARGTAHAGTPPAPARPHHRPPPLAAPRQDMRALHPRSFPSPLRMSGNTQHEGNGRPREVTSRYGRITRLCAHMTRI